MLAVASGLLGPRTTWYLARASGLTAWCLVLASVLLGLIMSSKPKWRGLPPAWRLDLHRFLAVLALFFTALHVAALLVDPSVPFRVVDVLVPFASRWRPSAIAGGVVAVYLLVVVEVTSLLMRKLPRKWWHRIHLSSIVLLAAATAHGLMSGTDVGNRAVDGVLAAAGVVTLQLVAYRLWRARTNRSGRSSGRAPVVAIARASGERSARRVRTGGDEGEPQAVGARP